MSLWFQISATVSSEHAEGVQAAFLSTAPGGVALEEPVDILGPEQGFRVRTGEPVMVHAYVPSTELGALLIDDLRKRLASYPEVELTARPVYEEDWAVSWREFFGVVQTGGRVVVVPSWIEHDELPGQVIVRVDPGRAFGTGHHETTRLCLLALDEHVKQGMSFLDVGTGSGILSMAALALGARVGLALDIDPSAVEVARENLRAAGLEGRVEVRQATLEPGHGSEYECVTANIFADPIIEMAGPLAAALAPGGILIASGILGADGSRVAGALATEGLTLQAVRYQGDWCALEMTRG